MDEETKTESSKASPLMDTQTAPNLIEQAKAQVATYKAENDRREALVQREEEANAIKMLSGRTMAGQESLTPEDLEKAKAQQQADEITNAFK